jgi:hypothetical protein
VRSFESAIVPNAGLETATSEPEGDAGRAVDHEAVDGVTEAAAQRIDPLFARGTGGGCGEGG